MALETVLSTIDYTGNNSTVTPYPIPFSFLATGHIQVTVTDAADAETILGAGDFSVTRFASGLGELTTTAAHDNTNTLTVERVTPTTQPVVLTDGALIPADTLETALDRLAMIAQELKTRLEEESEAGELDTKADKLLATRACTGTAETLVLTDAGKRVTMDNASANTLTVPPNSTVAIAIGEQILVQQIGAGTTTIAAGAGVTVRSRGTLVAIAGQWGVVALIKDDTNLWTLAGDRA